MKRIIYTSLLCIFHFLSYSQKAPDFQFKDIDGNTQHLYNYLKNNKAVLVDFSTTWCKPCWKIHESHFLDKMLSIFGPNGTNQLEVLFIECDTTTTIEDLKGTGQNTLGNWTKDATYPIIDLQGTENEILDENHYNILGYPTLIMISPLDSTITEYKLFEDSPNLEKASSILFNILGAKNGSDLQVSLIESNSNTCNSSRISFYAVNASSEAFNNPSFQLIVNDKIIQELKYNGTISPTTIKQLTFEDANVDLTKNNNIQVKCIEEDDHADNNMSLLQSKDINIDNQIQFIFKTDKYSFEDQSQIIIYDDLEKIVYDSGILENEKFYEIKVNLQEKGCYRIVLLDKNGDGFGKTILIKDSSDKIIFNEPNLEKESVIPVFVNTITSIQNFKNQVNIDLFPNPTKSKVFIKTHLSTSIHSMEIINDLGKIVKSYDFDDFLNEPLKEINVSTLNQGIYVIKISLNNAVYLRKFIKIN